MKFRVPPWVIEGAYIGAAALLVVPIAGRLTETQPYRQLEQLPLIGPLARGAHAWIAQTYNP